MAAILEQTPQDALIPAVVAERKGMLEKLWRAEKDARDDAAKRLRVNRNDAEWLIEQMPDEPEKHFKWKPKFCPGIIPKALDQLTYLYDDGPTRTTGTDADDAAWSAALWDYGAERSFDAAMKRVDRLTRLTGHTLIMPAWQPSRNLAFDLAAFLRGGDAPTVSDPGLTVSICTRDRFVALPTPFDPCVPEAVVTKMLTRQVLIENRHTVETVYFYWDDQFFGVLVGRDDGDWKWQQTTNPDGKTGWVVKHGYGRIPWVSAREDVDDGAFYGVAWQGKDLLTNLRSVYEIGTEYFSTAMIQRGQWVLEGDAEIQGWMAAYTVLNVTGEGTLSNVELKANLTGMREAVVTKLEILAKTMGLPTRTFRLDDRSAQSGIAIHLDRSELTDDRKARVTKARVWEGDFHETCALVWKRHGGGTLNADVATVFGSWAEGESKAERESRVTTELTHGLVSRKQALLELQPGLGDEEAAEIIADAGWTQSELDRVFSILDRAATLGEVAARTLLTLVGLGEDVVDALMLARREEPPETPEQDAPAEPEPSDAEPVEEVQAQALNGAQMTGMQGIVQATAAGELPAQAAKDMLELALPAANVAVIGRMVDSAVQFAATREAEKPEPPPFEENPEPDLTPPEGEDTVDDADAPTEDET